MKNPETVLHFLKEESPYMMSFVIITQEDNAIVIDGGRPADMPTLKACLGGRHIAAWILTHAHNDHISGFIDEYKKNRCQDFDIERVVYCFPPYLEWATREDVPAPEYFKRDIDEMLPAFAEIERALADISYIPKEGECLTVDECRIDFLFTYRNKLVSNPVNDSSLIFKVTTPHTSLLFLGDLGPEGGDILYEESRHLLSADIVQMAHHGHMGVGMEVYAAIAPKTCLWCCPEWLYNEPEIPSYLEDRARLFRMRRGRMYGVAVTRAWMQALGVQEHYVSCYGPHKIEI